MNHFRVAVLGLGRISSTIDDEVQGNPPVMLPHAPEVEVVAGAHPFPEQREDFRRRWGIEQVYEDYREMLARERPDIVSVATSAKPRPGIVADCAGAGVRLIFAE